MKKLISVTICIALLLVSIASVALATAADDEARWFGKYEEPVTVRLVVPTNAATTFPEGDSYSNNVWTRAWLEELGIKAEIMWEAVDADGGYQTKLDMAIVSNDLPDLIKFTNYSQFDKLQAEGKLEDLTQVYEDYAYPRFKTNIESDGGIVMSWGKVGDKLYGLPQGGIAYQPARMLWVRHDWFVESGKPEPKTIEDFIDLAKAFKDADPDNRFGMPFFKKVIGDGMCDITAVANAYGAYPRNWIAKEDGTVVYGTIQPEMLKAIKAYADLYAEGYIDPAFTSLDGGKVGEQLTTNKIGVIPGAFWLPSWPLNSLYETDQVDWDAYPVLPSEELDGPVKVQTEEPNGKLISVRAGYSNPEVLIKLLNFTVAKIDDPERQETVKFHSDPDAEVQYGYHMFNPIYIMWGDPMTNFNTQINVGKAFDNNDTSYLVTPHDWTQYQNLLPYFEHEKAGEKISGGEWASYKFWIGPNSAFGVLNKYFADDSYFVSALTGYQTPTMVEEWGNLVTLEDQYVTEIIAGARPLEDFEEFVATWNALGGAKITEEVNEWYKAKNG